METLENRIKSAKKLKQDVQKKIDNWNERSQFTLKGVKNLSRGDMDVAILFADNIINRGTYKPLSVMMSGLKEVLEAYNLIESEW